MIIRLVHPDKRSNRVFGSYCAVQLNCTEKEEKKKCVPIKSLSYFMEIISSLQRPANAVAGIATNTAVILET